MGEKNIFILKQLEQREVMKIHSQTNSHDSGTENMSIKGKWM